MNKKRFAVLTLITGLSLSGCQILTGYNQIDDDNTLITAQALDPIAGEINLTCQGTYHCEIVQIDKTPIISAQSHEPVNPTMLAVMQSTDTASKMPFSDRFRTTIAPDITPLSDKNAIKIVPLSASNIEGLTNYYLRLKPTKHEVQVNFYPENNLGYIERFAMIHEFTQPGNYELRAYRKKPSSTEGSLLENASPNPLCVDLTFNGRLQRHFCKLADIERQGEFVESSVIEVS